MSDEARARLPMLSELSVSNLLGEAIRRIHVNESVSSLFMKSRGPRAGGKRH